MPQPRLRTACLVATLLLLTVAPVAGAGVEVGGKVVGREQTVFDWTTQHCPPHTLSNVTGTDSPQVQDMPDQPPRAFRTASGTVTLFASNRVVLRMAGPDLDHLRRVCRPVLVSPYAGADASSYAMRVWLYSPYTTDGTHVYGLLHTEYHGDSNLPATPQNCPSGSAQLCWYNAITLATSTNAGADFQLAGYPPDHLVASIPYPYDPNANSPAGYFETSNIIARNGFYYALMTAMDYRAQRRGTCLIRTNQLGVASSWRGWNGTSFGVRFIDPYTAPGLNPFDHVCRPLAPDNLGVNGQGLVYSPALGRYIAVDAGEKIGAGGHPVDGVWFSTSPDLIDWTPRQLLWRQPTFNDWHPGEPNPVGYASLIDPTSASRNFSTIGRDPYLYFVRDNWAHGNLADRDVHRVRVEFSAR